MARLSLVFVSLLFLSSLAMPPPDLYLPRLEKRASNCAAARKGANGITKNIKIQKQEIKDTKAVKKVDPGVHGSGRGGGGTTTGGGGGGSTHHRRDSLDTDVAGLTIVPGDDTPLLEARASTSHSTSSGGGRGGGKAGGFQNNKVSTQGSGGGGKGGGNTKVGSSKVGSSKVSASNFKASKAKLQGTIADGVKQRKSNQKTLPKDNKAQAGLSKVAKAQKAEGKLAGQLDGTRKDKGRLKTLNGDFKAGIKQNKQNRVDALAGCKRDIDTYNGLMKRMVDLGEIEAHTFTPLETGSIELEMRDIEDMEAVEAAVQTRDVDGAGDWAGRLNAANLAMGKNRLQLRLRL